MNISGNDLLGYVITDFECAWDGIATNLAPCARGNFMFARQATILLELICRICKSDETGNALKRYSNELNGIDSRYFIEFPHVCWKRRSKKDFDFPNINSKPYNTLLALIFDLIRNGQSHQYQQLSAKLSDDITLGIGLTGAEPGSKLIYKYEGKQRTGHLRCDTGITQSIWIYVRTDVFFTDLRNALYQSNIREMNLNPIHIEPRILSISSKDILGELGE